MHFFRHKDNLVAFSSEKLGFLFVPRWVEEEGFEEISEEDWFSLEKLGVFVYYLGENRQTVKVPAETLKEL